MPEIDPDSPELVYLQAARILRERVGTGQYTVRLPGEVELAQELGVARQTVRKAVALLVEEGLVTVVRSKGIYVNRVR